MKRDFFLCFLLLSLWLSAQETTPRDSLDEAMKKDVHYGPPPEVEPIRKALAAKDYQQVKNLANQLLNASNSSGEGSYGYFIKSLAYIARAQAQWELGAKFTEALQDEKAAAELGNLKAIQRVLNLLLENYSGKSSINTDYHASLKEIEHYLRMGAELGDPGSAKLLGSRDFKDGISEDEQLYWHLLGVMEDPGMGLKERRDLLNADIGKAGNYQTTKVLRRYSLSGGSLGKRGAGFPRRGIIATLFADVDLRGSFEVIYGWSPPRSASPPETPTIAEDWQIYKKAFADTGFVNAYMLVPGDRKFDDPQIVSAPTAKIIANLNPDDRVFVRCGPLAHVAIVYKVDRADDRIYFADGVFQFWQPAYNSCIKSFALTEQPYHRYVATVSISELTPILQAVVTMGDKTQKKRKRSN